jgi:hypothetical protein
MIRTALRLAECGLYVFPCKPRDKRPATVNGLKDATVDPSVIERWWQQEPDFNVAIATGAASRVFVVDIDGAETKLQKLEAEHGALPLSVEAITARGRHVYFRWPDRPVRNSAGKIAPGIDTRGEGGYVLAPPSVHPTGRRYAWSVDSSKTLAAAPGWLLAKIAEPNGDNVSVTPPSEWRELVKGVAEGARDCSATRLTGYLLRRRIDAVVVLELLQSWNVTHCTPPLPAADVDRIVNSIAGKELRRRQGHD